MQTIVMNVMTGTEEKENLVLVLAQLLTLSSDKVKQARLPGV